jgi:glucan phosphoethanolaminetransferase (alkaline phosphatase superfamily)
MGSKASTPVVVKEVLNQACNMHDLTTSMNTHSQLIMLISVLLIVVVLVVSGLLVCLLRRHYHRKIREFSHRIARSVNV